MSIVLASGSPRRRDLMARAGMEFEVVVSPAEEIHDPSMAPDRLCEENATLKAAAVARNYPQATVIGATPFSPPSGPVTGSFNGLHPESKFLAIKIRANHDGGG
ncbi:MAG: Maf family protein [Verrucomicrobiota bacterium]